jgi:hypothetical protein
MLGFSVFVRAPLELLKEGHATQIGSDSQLSSFHSNPSYSGVGYYAPADRTTLNPRVFMCSVIA